MNEPVRPDAGHPSNTSTASASCASNDPATTGPTGPASPNGAATAPPAASAGDSPAERAPESPVPSPICEICRKPPSEIEEYVEAASEEGFEMHPDEYVRRDEGTYNPQENAFFCTGCYIDIGMPLHPQYRQGLNDARDFRVARRPR